MGKVDAFKLVGVECWFCSQDHRPPHFHARKRGKWDVRVFFMEAKDQMLERVRGARAPLPARDVKAICDAAEEHRDQLLAEWEEKVVCDD